MARRDRESTFDSDADDLLFGAHPEDAHPADAHPADAHPDSADSVAGAPAEPPRPSPRSRVEQRHAQRRRQRSRRNRRVLGVSVMAIVAVLAAAAYFIGVPAYRYFNPADYDGAGNTPVTVTVHANDGVAAIGAELEQAGVVASEQAFVDAADGDSRAQNIQVGSYRLRKGMSAGNALTSLLDPATRVSADIVVPEGANVYRIEQLLARPRCTSGATDACGLGVTKAQVTAALRDVGNLGIPTDYLPAPDKQPATIEGFLYPATYSFDDDTTLTDALQQMVGKFTDVARSNRFSAAAAKVGLEPYQALVVASMVQAEAKYPEDMPKVARVIMNRLADKTALKIDATSVYAAERAGVDPKKTNFATFDSPYNTYRNTGLPPTPISNPGSDALKAAVSPAAGNWTFYVNGSADGHLYFTASESDFVKAQQRCFDNDWGCAAP